jgi:ribosomal protein S18 acetylase RimI-like enzyme
MAEAPAVVEVRAQRAPGPLIRPGTRDHVPGLVALGRAVVPPTYGPIDAVYAQRMLDEWWTTERFTDSLTRAHFLVAEHDGEVVAMATVGRLSASHRDFPHVTGDREVMWKLYVHPEHQGLGLGRRLLAEVESMVEGDELWLEVVDGNEQAFAFYRAHGFAEVERVPGPPFPDDVWMRKDLRRGEVSS